MKFIFNHVGISVADLDRSIAFYGEMFGMVKLCEPFEFKGPQFEAIMAVPGADGRMCMIGVGDLWIELFEFHSPTPKPKDPNYPVADHGISHFGITTDDMDAIHARLVAAGVPIHSPIQSYASGRRAIYCRDPDGNVFEIIEPKQPAQA